MNAAAHVKAIREGRDTDRRALANSTCRVDRAIHGIRVMDAAAARQDRITAMLAKFDDKGRQESEARANQPGNFYR